MSPLPILRSVRQFLPSRLNAGSETRVFVFVLARARACKHKHGLQLNEIRDPMNVVFTSDRYMCPKSCIHQRTRMRTQKPYLCSSKLCQRWCKIIMNMRWHLNNTTPHFINLLTECLSCISMCYRVLQGVAGCCSVLQWIVVCCSVLQAHLSSPASSQSRAFHVRKPTNMGPFISFTRTSCFDLVLQCVAVRCSTVQCGAACESVLDCVRVLMGFETSKFTSETMYD